MKKNLIALTVLASSITSAHAASSVTMYGTVDVNYQGTSRYSFTQGMSNAGNLSSQNSKFGIKGSEDLGNGLSAIFKLEGRFDADTGSFQEQMFSRESTVGLQGAFGKVRFGRAPSAMWTTIGLYNPGNGVSTYWNPYSSSSRHSNSMFYDYDNGGLNIGGNITTKGGYNDRTKNYAATVTANEGVAGTKVAYGLHASYMQKDKFSVGVAYQNDALDKHEFGVGAYYTFKPVTIGGAYTRGKQGAGTRYVDLTAYISAQVTAADSVYVKYMRQTLRGATSAASQRADNWTLGGQHNLSKRTSIYADVSRYKVKTGKADSGFLALPSLWTTGKGYYAYDVGVKHAF